MDWSELKEENKIVPILIIKFPLNVDLTKAPLVQIDKKKQLKLKMLLVIEYNFYKKFCTSTILYYSLCYKLKLFFLDILNLDRNFYNLQ